jgi:integrase
MIDDSSPRYYFRHPTTGKVAGLGSDRLEAIEKATLMNAALIQAGITKQKAIPKGVRMQDIIKRWEPSALDGLAESSVKVTANWIRIIGEAIGQQTANAVTTAMLFQFISQHPASSQKRLKGLLVRLFDYSLSTGERTVPTNPAVAVHVDKQPEVKRQRLTLDQFRAIYDASPVWAQSAMMIMLQTTLRPSDVLRLRFDQLEGSVLRSEISKTKKHLAIHLNSLAMDAINRQRQSGMVCPYIIHRRPERRRKRRGCDHLFQVTLDYWSGEFTDLRDQLGVADHIPKDARPTLYEIRALAAHLYEQQGLDRSEVQALMAHTREEMTARYQARHGVRYVEVKSGLIL